MKPLSDEIIIAALKDYGVATSARLCDQIRIYIDLLLRWNQKTSLTTVTDPAEILRFHFGESLLAVEARPHTAWSARRRWLRRRVPRRTNPYGCGGLCM